MFSPSSILTTDNIMTSSASSSTASSSSPQSKLPPLPPSLASNIPLIHRILLADPSDYADMTLSGSPRVLDTPSYQEFCATLDGNTNSSDAQDVTAVTYIMKRAFRDQVCERLQSEHTLQPAKDLLLELHHQLRALVPSRTDLHGILQDDAVREVESTQQFMNLLVQAAKALSLLESEARAESTHAWIASRTSSVNSTTVETDSEDDHSEKTIATSLLYLLWKTELCQRDKQDFYFSQLWLPQLLQKGPQIERDFFEAQYGALTDPSTALATRQWLQASSAGADSQIDEATSESNSNNLNNKTPHNQHHTRIRQAWVDDLLFTKGSLSFPEVFHWDQGRFQQIRANVRMAVSGSTLALHASQTAGQPASVLASQLEPSSPLDIRRAALVRAMGERHKSEEEYRQDITKAVVALAEFWDPALDDTKRESLTSRTQKVMDAQDPVMDLLEKRMKACFGELVTTPPGETLESIHLQSGTAKGAKPNLSRRDAFILKANELFCSKGLAFFSSDLALASWNALRVIEVAIAIYDEALLKQICNAS